MVCTGKSHLEMDDDWGYPYFRKPPNDGKNMGKPWGTPPHHPLDGIFHEIDIDKPSSYWGMFMETPYGMILTCYKHMNHDIDSGSITKLQVSLQYFEVSMWRHPTC